MDIILYYIRDNLVGTHYFIYTAILLFLMFAIIGYLFKQKYGKLDVVLNTSQTETEKIESSEEIELGKFNDIYKSDKTLQQPGESFRVPGEDTTSILIQSTRVQNLEAPEAPVEQKVEPAKPTVLPNVEEKVVESENAQTSTSEELDNVTPVKKEIEQDLTGVIPDIKF